MALLLMAGATAASAQEVTQAEKERAMQYLETTRKKCHGGDKRAVGSAVELQAGAGPLSVAQVMEHIAAAEDLSADW